MPTYAICEASWWATPNWAGKGSEAARDAAYDGTYTSVSTWESARDGVATGGTTEIGEITGPWTADDTGNVAIAGWDDTVTIIVQTVDDSRNDTGIYDESSGGPYRLVLSAGNQIFIVSEPIVTIDGLQIKNTVLADASSTALRVQNSGTTEIGNCIIPVPGDGNSIEINSGSMNAYNNICYGIGTLSAASEGIYIQNATTVNLYNNLTHNFGSGIERDAGTVTVTNHISFENNDDFEGTMTIDSSASDDGDGTNAQTLNATSDYAAEFNDLSSDDYNPVSGASSVDNGATDPGSGLFSDDILGVSRPSGSAWDIGPFEYVAAAAAGNPWYYYAQHGGSQ
jgi:hypothetical protein